MWESNRTGRWELYRMETDGTGFGRITDLEAASHKLGYTDYLRPRVSPDGTTVLFGYAERRGKPVEVWLVPSTGGRARMLTVGNPLNWSPDGESIYFVRDHRVLRHEIGGGRESPVHEARVPPDGRRGSMVGGLRADLRAAVFRTGKNEYFVFDKGTSVKTTGGCEPGFTPDGRFMYWVEGPRDFRAWDIAAGREIRFFGRPSFDAYDYTYFPTVSGGNRWLAYGASPGQHDHSKSDYEIFVQELEDWRPVGKPVRLSWNKRTDRWPHLHVYREGAPPGPLPGLVADSGVRPAPEDAAPARPAPPPPEVFPVADERAPDELAADELGPAGPDEAFPVADDREETFPVAGEPAPTEPDEAFPVAATDGPVPF